MRKNKFGQPPKLKLKKEVVRLRDKEDLSFKEICETLNLSNKYHAFYHYKTAVKFGIKTAKSYPQV
jgi:hypothetical protein